ncbi:XRE family transcriptional regulator [Nocardia pseudobrasiliensis]|uniref:Putative XRE-type DNA-binding protein n=1 Tax=Nocardia pseudobrasiliensis TaxID=45979 RepID=A0A370I4W0_9NOCA|nr:XRE family transcriptional regulator [Nocardia pseudobrasiliensis]RDI65745.1 putative XRE-type DNA-binding protein [Nocardia pseudobrasiliensis]
MPTSLELRTKLIDAIADAIEAKDEQIQEIALDTGIDRHEVGRLADRNVTRFSLERLVNYCAPFGLTVRMSLEGADTEPHSIDDPAWLEARNRSADTDYTDSGYMSRELGLAIAVAVDRSPLTQGALGDSVGLPRTTVSKLKSRRPNLFRLDSLVDFAPKFGLTVDIIAEPARQT